MSTHTESGARNDSGRQSSVPAYGPIEAVVGFVVFYAVFDRVTPTVVEVLTDAVPDLSASAVGFGLASFLWFVLIVTVFDQIRRQLVALGVVAPASGWRSISGPATLSDRLAFQYLAVSLVGSLLAAGTFERATTALASTIRLVATQDASEFAVEESLWMIVFFVAAGVAAYALDRLLIGVIRTRRSG